MPNKRPMPQDRPESPAARELAEAMFRAAKMEPREQFDTGVDAGRKETSPERVEPGRRGVCASGPARRAPWRPVLLAAFAVLLSLPFQAEAQTTGICGRTQQVRDAILARIPGVSNCADVTAAHLAAIDGTLALLFKNITALSAEDFDGLTALEQLRLNENPLTELPDGVFDNLTSLAQLEMRENRLTELPDDVFDNLTSLWRLGMFGNPLTELPADVFDNLTSLRWLSLNGNNLTELPADVFDNLTSLTILDLDANDLTELPADVFDNLTSLTELWLSGNDLTELPDGVFDNLTSLELLELRGNDLTELPDGVFDNLTSLELLELRENDLTELRDDVFDGLTSLTELRLGDNDLTALPADVFDGLTSLEELYLIYNDLTALPDNVFDGLTSLWLLYLHNNDLTELPDDVFEPLTSLRRLQLQNNPGAPFAPTAVALPDDGTVPVAGGTVTLDGSGSDGGPWGANVTYSWALTSPASGVTVTFDDNTSAMPVVTIPAGANELTFTLTVTGRGNVFNGTAPGTDTATVTAPNAAPSFTSPATFDAAENQTAVGTAQASDGDAGDSVTYAIRGGADASQFAIVEATGVLTFVSAPNFEAPADADTDNDYVVVVRATSGAGARAKTADQTITVTVTDMDGEAPGAPSTPTVATASLSSVTVTWAAPENAGPPITDYDYRYRVKLPPGSWTEVTITTLSATITGLVEDTEYEVQVRATNAEGTGGWSDPPGSGSTALDAAPTFTSSSTFDAAENRTAVGTAQASDSNAGDSVTGYAIQGGADASKFSIVEATGVLTFVAAPNFEAPADADTNNDYVVVVRATSGAGAREKTADQTITVTVTDMDGEAPGIPVAPTVATASVSSVTVTWAAPTNAGPAITDYDYRYRVKSPQGSWTEVTDTPIAGLGATIGELADGTEYEVQVRATNAEGTGGWSDPPGSGSTASNAAASFTSSATFDAAENQTAVGTAQASDSDTGDSVTGYAIQGGADPSQFTIVEATGVLTFVSAPNFEAPADADTNNDYVVVVRATSGLGERAKTADQTITVRVTDVDGEAPGAPTAPTVSAASLTSLNVSWAAPANAGPAITDYDYRYRVKSPQGPWTEVTNTPIPGLGATIGGLAENTEYEVQVRATNAEGASGWSDPPGSGSTDSNAAASFTSPATFEAAENQTAVGRAQASDGDTGDSVTGYAIQGGADASQFAIVASTGVLTFVSAPNFEAPADADANNDYVVVVRATSGLDAREKTADRTITVTVTDVDGEAPGIPAPPTVSSASLSSVTVTWAAPTNAGPAITDYDYRYRVKSPQGSWTEVTDTPIPGLGATIAGLAGGTDYEVQVRATNAEGTGGWSDPGSGSTDSNAAAAFTSPATFDAAENQTAVGRVAASDGDAGDSVTGYAIQGGADPSKFSIVSSTGVLTFVSAPNFEAPADADTGNDYVVVVRATSGEGARAKTADQTITVTVTDVGGEAPGVPAAPVVSSASVTSVTAAWTAPANAGPAITDYDYRYRVTSPQGSWTEVTTTTITALSATITQLTEDTEYDVQVRATNDEGTSGWSDPGTGTAGSTEAGAIANAPENLQATAGNAEVTLRWDAPNNDSGANITGYAYRYKESGGDFIAYTDIPESGPGEANARSYTVTELTNGLEYVFHVRALNEHGGGLPAEVTVMLPGIVSSESEELPTEVVLWGNYPNPFNPETTIRYALPQAGQVHLAVYDLLGHEVAILVDRSKPAGNHTVRFGADNLPSGLYVYRLQAQDKTIVRTMILVK